MARTAEAPLQIVAADGFPLAATSLPAAGDTAVVIAPALGVPRRYYESFARYLVERGNSVVVFDYRGIGDSRKGPQRGSQVRMQDWGSQDIDAVLNWARTEFKADKLFLVGHSCGTQLPGLAAASEQLTGLIAVAASAPHWRVYPAPMKFGVLLLAWLMIPALTAGRERILGRHIGMGSGKIPVGVIRQWAQWVRSRGYLFDPSHGLDLSRYGRLKMPLLSWRFDDDEMAPEPAVEALLANYPAAQITRRVARAAEHGGSLGHFGFFRPEHRETLWRETADWIEGASR